FTSRLGYRLTSSRTSTAIRPPASAICSLLIVVADDHVDQELADDLLRGRGAPGQPAAEQLSGVAADRLNPLHAGLGQGEPDHPPVGFVELPADVPGLLQLVEESGGGCGGE